MLVSAEFKIGMNQEGLKFHEMSNLNQAID